MAGARLQRSQSDKWIAGICGGVAQFTGLSPAMVRLAFVVFGIFGVGELVYLILWIVMPKG